MIHGSANRSFTVVGLQPMVGCTLRLSAVNSNYTSFGPYTNLTVVTSKPNGMWLHIHEVWCFNFECSS